VAAALESIAQKLQVWDCGLRFIKGFTGHLQAPTSKAVEAAAAAAGKTKGDSLFGSILKEEEELEMIKALPADSALRLALSLPKPSAFEPPLRPPTVVLTQGVQGYAAEAFGGHDRVEACRPRHIFAALCSRAFLYEFIRNTLCRYEMQRIKQQSQVDRMSQVRHVHVMAAGTTHVVHV
jgi:hypothetical protein